MTSSRRSLLRAAAILPFAAAFTAVHAQTSAANTRPKLLIHVSENEPARWNMALANAKNAQDAMGGADKIDIEIVSNGPSVLMLKSGSPITAGVESAQKSGVKVVACEVAMGVMKVKKDEMISTVATVPAGIIEITRKQQEGWAYVRP